MERLYDQALRSMEVTLHELAERVPKPQTVPHMGSFAYRYAERTVHQAIVQKLARIVSGLHAARLLLEHGLVQEQAVLQRTLDELREDVDFLALAVVYDDWTPLHSNYLDYFYQEEFDANTAIGSTQKRPMVSRRQIQSYLARPPSGATDPSTTQEVLRTVNKAYSGYVHGASPQIMDMYFGEPPRFQVCGMRGTLRQAEHREDLWNYFYRAIGSFGIAAKAFGRDELCKNIVQFLREFEVAAGKGYQ